MNRRTYLLVTEVLAEPDLVPSPHSGLTLEDGDSIYMINSGTMILRTAVPIDRLTTILNQSFELFFITDITKSDRAGKMHPRFWEFLRENEKVAAE